jgi:hypothetical protein
MRSEDREITREVHHGGAHSRCREHGCRTIHRVLLAEAAEVELHARLWQAHMRAVALDAAPADQRQDRRELRIAGHSPRIESPRTPQHAGGRIEEPTALAMTRIGVGEQHAGLVVDRHGRAAGRRIDARDHAVAAIARILGLDAAHLVDRRLGERLGLAPIARMQLDLVFSGHRAERDAVQAQKVRLTVTRP